MNETYHHISKQCLEMLTKECLDGSQTFSNEQRTEESLQKVVGSLPDPLSVEIHGVKTYPRVVEDEPDSQGLIRGFTELFYRENHQFDNRDDKVELVVELNRLLENPALYSHFLFRKYVFRAVGDLFAYCKETGGRDIIPALTRTVFLLSENREYLDEKIKMKIDLDKSTAEKILAVDEEQYGEYFTTSGEKLAYACLRCNSTYSLRREVREVCSATHLTTGYFDHAPG